MGRHSGQPLRRFQRLSKVANVESASNPGTAAKATGALSGEQSSPERTAIRVFLELLAAAFLGVAADRLMNTGVASAALPFVVGIVLFLAGVFWGRFARALGPRFARTAGEVATDFRWWVGALLALLLYAGAPGFGRALDMLSSRIHAAARQPSHSIGAPHSTAHSTDARFDLKIQFNAIGAKPVVISEQNMKASISAYKRDIYTGCPQDYININPFLSSTGQNDPGCVVPEHKIRYSYVIVIYFTKPNIYKKMQLDSHGATLPDWDVLSLTTNFSVLYIHDSVTNAVVDAVPTN